MQNSTIVENTMNEPHEDQARQEESRRILNALARESGAGSDDLMTRSVGYLAARGRDASDHIEVWGTRIGRWIGIVVICTMVLILMRILGVI
jgi:hypothetical protein